MSFIPSVDCIRSTSSSYLRVGMAPSGTLRFQMLALHLLLVVLDAWSAGTRVVDKVVKAILAESLTPLGNL